MMPKDCKYFEQCSASLCPLDPELKLSVWYPEENGPDEICKNKEFSELQVIKTQRKIARAVRNKNKERDDYFTFEMLNISIVVRAGIREISGPPDTVKDPMKWYAERERNWILNHPEKKQLSNEEIERRRLRMKSIRKVPSTIHFSEVIDSKGVISSKPSTPSRVKE